MVTNLAELLRRSKRADLWSYAAAEDGEATPDALDLTGGVVLVLGSEGSGIRPLVRQRCDGSVRIPMHGAIGSLNVVGRRVAAAVRGGPPAPPRVPRSPFTTNTCSCERANAPQRTCVLVRTCYVLRHQLAQVEVEI